MPSSETNQANGATHEAEKAPSLREIAEAAYHTLTTEEGAGEAQQPPEVDDLAQPRDARGRFAPKEAEPGEADGEQPTQPRDAQAQPQEPHPAPLQGEAAQAPANWAAADRAEFDELTEK